MCVVYVYVCVYIGQAGAQRLQNYSVVLSQLRHVLVEHMAKPEEVIMVKDDNGNLPLFLSFSDSTGPRVCVLCMYVVHVCVCVCYMLYVTCDM